MSIINSQPRIGAAGQSTGFKIERSLRFNSADSAYLNRTPASAGNRRTWTWSGWVKRSAFGTSGIFQGYFDSTTLTALGFNSTDTLFLQDYTGPSVNLLWETPAVFRDPSAWYHIVVAFDTTQASSANAVKLYVNGVQQTLTFTAFSGSYTQNREGFVNNTNAQELGKYSTGNYLNGYLADIHLIDGSALTPSSFGETDSATGVWKPKAYSGSYGTNGFYLKFADNSGTTSTTLGKDSSGNGNNWTPNNFSVTAGAGNDSLVDTPTPYGTDTGAGGEVRGNYCTMNPLKQAGATLTNGNLDVSIAAGATNVALGTIGVTSGKWYWEVTLTTASNIFGMIGVADASAAVGSSSYKSANGWAYYSGGQFYTNDTSSGSPATYTTNDVIGVALDMDAGTLVFYKNGSSQGTAYNTGLSGKTITPLINTGSGTYAQTYTVNFGHRPFAYTAPSGFKALCTQNLPTPTIGATSTTQASQYFTPVLYTGDGTDNRTISAGMTPDWTWIKARNNTNANTLFDSVRGTGKYLFTNTTDAENAYGTLGWTNSGPTTGGFKVDAGTNGTINGNGTTFVAWNWKANGAGSTNTSGTITSTVSANTTAGFSIVTYTGNGTNGATIGHGLGVVPSMLIVKSRSGSDSWIVYHTSLGNTKFAVLNNTDAAQTASTLWNNTSPTSTVFTVGTSGGVNTSTGTYVAYCFAPVAGYSAFGSYTGNGSTDGVFVYLGFRPRYLLIKRTDSSTGANWWILDTSRSPYNLVAKELRADTSTTEDSYNMLDMLSNGFKFRDADVSWNGSGATYIYAAFAENPFKYSLAR